MLHPSIGTASAARFGRAAFAVAFLLLAPASAMTSRDRLLTGGFAADVLEPGQACGDPTAGSCPPATGPAPLAKPDRAPAAAATVTYSGFQVFQDGSARLSVTFTGSPEVEASHSGKKAEYLLRKVAIPVRNNKNALLTRHFASVVTSIRFVADPAPTGTARGKKGRAKKKEGGTDTRLVVELREAVKPAHRLTRAADGSTLLVIDFPKPSTPPPPEPDPMPPTVRPSE